ncbi:glycosyltransferase family 2 protein [Kitasatospora aburaviensis]|uniref:Glycosyltransferase family 2 protein n=1 Tax=Kitasatospora aburaviensis TaxID=67265 RepID=A0ABW1F6F3_9ACTN
MTVISVITPVYNGGHAFLGEAYDSLLDQDLPDGWTWQWVVQEDGETRIPATVLPTDDPRISYGTGRRGGAAMARTMALARVTGSMVRPLDADDMLPAGALRRGIEALVEHPEIGWAVSSAVDLLPDGTLRESAIDPPAGLLASGLIAESYRAGRFAVMGTTLTVYTDLLHAVGGWPAVPASEDAALLVLLEAVAPGWMIAEPGEIYRKHDGQVTAQAAHWEEAERDALAAVLLTRLNVLHRTGWRWTPDPELIAKAPS